MKTVSIKELHGRTGHWVRRVDEEREIIVTERGRPVARLVPPPPITKDNPFLRRRLLPGVSRLMERPMPPGSTDFISEGRDGR